MQVIDMVLLGRLTRSKLEEALSKIPDDLEGFGLLVDCTNMQSYDADARSTFVEWNRKNATRIAKVAVVTNRSLWHMVVSAMSFASSQDMRAFGEPSEAYDWMKR